MPVKDRPPLPLKVNMKVRKNQLLPETQVFVQAVGHVLKRYRLDLDLTSEAAAFRAGCSRSALVFIETARNTPSLPMLLAILKVYKKTPLRLLYDVESLISSV